VLNAVVSLVALLSFAAPLVPAGAPSMACRHSSDASKRCCCPKPKATEGARLCKTGAAACCEVSRAPVQSTERELARTAADPTIGVPAPAWALPLPRLPLLALDNSRPRPAATSPPYLATLQLLL
jgi:hypothetical protein